MTKNKNTKRLITDQRLRKAGMAPGTLTKPSEKKESPPSVTLISYSESSYKVSSSNNFDDILSTMDTANVNWINIDGVHDIEMIAAIGAKFNIHSLTLEDIVNQDQRPKFEDYDDYDVAVMKMFSYKDCIHSEQLAIVILENTVISFQDADGKDVFDPVRERLKAGKGRIRKGGADYLAYTLIDTVVDSYFIILDTIGDKINNIDDQLNIHSGENTLKELHELKREMIHLRKAIWPMREMINTMQRSESPLIKEATGIYLRDVYDHTIRVIETIDTYKDMLSGMMDIYHSMLSNRMNEIMKVLTIISTIFIPVTFIAGVYGMNFHYMPELQSKYGYIGVWAVMILIMALLLIYFKRKKWL